MFPISNKPFYFSLDIFFFFTSKLLVFKCDFHSRTFFTQKCDKLQGVSLNDTPNQENQGSGMYRVSLNDTPNQENQGSGKYRVSLNDTLNQENQGSGMYRVSFNDTPNQENQGSGIKDVQGIT